MKKMTVVGLLILLIAAAFLAGSWYQKKSIVAGTGARKVLYYVDPMNPGIKSDKPGTAPCGMPLEPVYEGSTDSMGMLPGTVNVSPEQQQLIGVKVATVEKAASSHTVRLLGRVVPDEARIYRMNSASDGWVKKIYPATTGSFVTKDELLATFYAPDFFPAIKAYLYGLRSLARFESNDKETQGQIEVANANIDSFKVSLRNLGMSEHQIDELARTRESADNIEIRAPQTGFIMSRNIYLGQRFERGAELYRIADLSRVWVLADVFENESDYFKPGAAAQVVLPNQKKTFLARVSNVLPQFDASSRTLKMRLEVNNPGYLLRPDMFVDVELPVACPSTVAVPVDAVRYSGLKKTVYIDLGKGFFEPREVETGWRFGDRVEIVKGLVPGERIVVSGNFLIDSESRMRMAAAGIAGAVQKDPVCGMDVDETKAKPAGRVSDYGTAKYYFCSDRCKQRFDQDPEQFLKKAPAKERQGVHTPSQIKKISESLSKSPPREKQAPVTMTKMETSPGNILHKDPICNMDVDEETAKAAGRISEHNGKKFYFCSDACKQEFEKEPDRYAGELKETRLINNAVPQEARQ